jgi:hypothetical protein
MSSVGTVSAGLIVLTFGVASCNSIAPLEAGADARPDSPSVAAAPSSEPETHAVERAKAALVAQGVRVEALAVKSVSPAEWSDSSLGCRTPGVSYLQVITSGFIVIFDDGEKPHEVHVAGDAAVICSDALAVAPRRPRSALPARNLDVMVTKAQQDLATQLGVDVSTVRLQEVQAASWPKGPLGCDEGSAPAPEVATTPGYRLLFTCRGRTYTYHTDLSEVRACPPIAPQ